ncbi:uncharacterized protein EV154DRAFT_564773 [Mucor mucedo]|uniref:uncharacterized protein n=1 Tax=Mucor mucedo TaxID=29922 RepID=UPI00221E6A60|nr:uncharacterized protein EV154DRAFT_564773 [Mucor mucedo]KAI7889993.1 hypothetical protein EV154DRAFT_564773 [Mucor mucedo]
MAVGKLSVTPVTVRGLSTSGLNDARLFVGCYVQENEKHRTHSESGPEPLWKNVLTCNVPEGQNFLHIELVNESPNNGGILATSKIALNQVFEQGTETKWSQLNSSSGQSLGEIKLDLSFSGTNSVSSVTSSFGGMNLAGGQQVAYQQTTSHSQTISHNQSESRQGSYSSLGPANPIPSNYGSGSPPPFTPPAAVSYPEKSGNNFMPGGGMPGSGMPGSGMPSAGGLVAEQRATVNTENMTKDEFEEAKARGAVPTWMKYGGGVLAGAAALGLSAWGAHELKERYDEKKEEEERLQKQQEKPAAHFQQQGQTPYTIHNQQGQQQQQQQHQQQQHQSYPQPPQQQFHSSDKKEQKSEHKKEKKDKKKDKKYKKHGSDSDSSSSDSDSSDDERKQKKDKHHKKRDSDWN